MNNTFDKEAHDASYTETTTIALPVEMKYTIEAGMVSAYIPMIDAYFSAKTIKDAERKAQGIVAIWIKYNLENHMRKSK